MTKITVLKDAPKAPVTLVDGLSNVVAGLGGNNAKVGAASYGPSAQAGMADMAYRTSTWYGKILRIPVDDATRKWRKWNAPKASIEKIEREERRLGVRHKVHEAFLRARHSGGAALVIGGLRGDVSSELKIDSIQRGDIKFIHVLDRHQLTPEGLMNDPMSPFYGGPTHFRVTGAPVNKKVHVSRVVVVNGRKVPSSLTHQEFWGHSVWEHLADAIVAADSGAAILSALMHEAKVDILKIPGLTGQLAGEVTTNDHINRWTMMATLKSIAGIVLLDAGEGPDDKGEEWEQKDIKFSDLPEVQQTLLTIMAGAADIPVTRLLGEQGKGLGSTDSGSIRNYYDAVKAEQELRFDPVMAVLDEMLLRSALGDRPDDVWYEWNPLWEMTDKEKAEVDKIEADTAQVYSNSGLIPTSALEKVVQNRMIESGRWSGLEKALAEVPASELEGDGDGEGDEGSAPPNSPRLVVNNSDAAPKPLYVQRKVLNASDILAWARAQGFKETYPAEELHVTIAYSKTPVDWMKMGEAWDSKLEISEGGPRMLETFGETSVLLFNSGELRWRNSFMQEMGASWDHDEYQPHISITKGPIPVGAKPYQGKIILGPELFEDLNENWSEGVTES